MLHPIRRIGDGQHDKGNDEEIHAGLPDKAPAFHFPDHGACREARAQQSAEQGLQNDGADLISQRLRQLRRAGGVISARPHQRNADCNDIPDGNPDGEAQRSPQEQFLLHILHLIFLKLS